MALDFKGFQNMLQNMKDVQTQYDDFVKKFLTEMGMRTLGQTKKLTPVDTGNLRNRWELSDVHRMGDGLYITIFNPVEYASHVEDGHMQHKRFLPIEYLQQSKGNAQYLNSLYNQYGDGIAGVMLHDKWIPGYHMARISISKIEREIPARYEKALKEFINRLGAGN